ncbi:hypothetical protein ACFL27_05455 [candidate division CSSED10-310 bacterium]|uniref:Uncharacterized protein n=1 Tax=candidate division CSSED10-310 bacterium TaxID=2855610 RepID=A0ABV6YTX8_UNCC1
MTNKICGKQLYHDHEALSVLYPAAFLDQVNSSKKLNKHHIYYRKGGIKSQTSELCSIQETEMMNLWQKV